IGLAIAVSPLQAEAASVVPAAAPAAAPVIPGPGHDKVVGDVPLAAEPYVSDGAVWAFAEVGNQMVVGGNFTQVTSRGSTTVLTRPNIFVFDETTGQVSTTA